MAVQMVPGPRGEMRIPARTPVRCWITYGAYMPVATHMKTVGCEAYGCLRRRNGWLTRLDVADPAHAAVASWIRLHSGRTYTVEEAGTVVVFTFPAGQDCFDTHRVPIEREPIVIRRDGDWRGNPTGRRLVHRSVQDFVDDFGEHQLRLKEQHRREFGP